MSVTPDFTGWHRRTGEFLKSTEPVWAKGGETAGRKFMSGFKAGFRSEDMPTARIKTRADTAEADRKIREVARDRDVKLRVHTEFLRSPALLGLLGAAALGPTALGLGAGAAGLGVAFGAAGAGVAAFGALAKSELTKVTKAQQALTTAQLAYAKAATPAARKKALLDEALATKGLTSSERGLGQSLTLLSDSWKQLGRSEAPVIARSLRPWFDTAAEGLRFLPKLANPAGQAIGTLGREAAKALQAPFWGKFFTTLGQTGKTALLGFGKAAGHVADAFAHLFVTFAPDIRKLPGLIDKWAGSFDHWARSYKRAGFDSFMKQVFSRSNVATLKSDLGALGTTLSNVAKATAQLSPAAFLGLSKVLTILSKLSPGQIEAIGALYAAAKLTGGAAPLNKILKTIRGGAPEGGGGAGGAGKFVIGPGAVISAGLLAGEVIRAWSDSLSPAGTPRGRVSQAMQQAPGGALAGAGLFGGLEARLAPLVSNWFVTSPANWARNVTKSLARAFTGAGSWLKGAGGRIAHGLVSGWDASQHWVSTQFGRARSWAATALHTAVSWLSGTGRSIARGLGTAWNSASGWVAAQFGRAKSWVLRGVSGAVSWLSGTGRSIGRGLATGWDASSGAVRSALHRAEGWVTSAFAGAGSWLIHAGESVLGGLLSGLKAAVQPVQSFLGWLTSKIPSWKGPAARDATLLTPAGKAIMASLIKGLTSGYASVRAFLTDTGAQIHGAYTRLSAELGRAVKHGVITARADSGITAFLRRDTARLAVLAGRRQRIQNRINAADAYAANVTAGAKASYGIIGAAQAAAPASGGTPTAKAVIGQLRLDASRVRQFGHDIVKLRKMGLNRAYIDELVQDFTGGDMQAAAIAHEFATGPLSQIRQVNRAEAKIAQGSRYLGNQAANDMYEAAGQAGKGFLAGLERQKAAINKLMRQIADEMVRELKKRLGIHSPATATIAVGEMTGEGVAVGAKRSLARIRQAAGLMTAALMPAAALPGVGSTLAPGALALRVTYDGPRDGVIGALVKDLRYDIKHNAGGDVQKRLGRGKAR